MKQQLLTKAIRAKLPRLYAQDGKGMEAVAYVKFFYAYGSGEWFATEFDGLDTFFGWVQHLAGNPGGELGYFSLLELEAVPAKFNGKVIPGVQGIERDIHFQPGRLCDIGEVVKEAV